MAKTISLKASARTQKGRNAVKVIRSEGRIPANLYSKRTEPSTLQVCKIELGRALKKATSENLLVDLEIDNGGSVVKKLAIIQEIQHEPLSGAVLHLDLHELAADEKLSTVVPVETTGEPIGVKTFGGILEHILRELHVQCLPKDLPESIIVDVSSLNCGESLHVGQIVPPAGVEIVSGKDHVVCAVASPLVEVAKEAVAGAPAQPEVLKEKKPADGAAAPAKGGAAAKPAAKK